MRLIPFSPAPRNEDIKRNILQVPYYWVVTPLSSLTFTDIFCHLTRPCSSPNPPVGFSQKKSLSLFRPAWLTHEKELSQVHISHIYSRLLSRSRGTLHSGWGIWFNSLPPTLFRPALRKPCAVLELPSPIIPHRREFFYGFSPRSSFVIRTRKRRMTPTNPMQVELFKNPHLGFGLFCRERGDFHPIGLMTDVNSHTSFTDFFHLFMRSIDNFRPATIASHGSLCPKYSAFPSPFDPFFYSSFC